jgi:hypothetical protein
MNAARCSIEKACPNTGFQSQYPAADRGLRHAGISRSSAKAAALNDLRKQRHILNVAPDPFTHEFIISILLI